MSRDLSLSLCQSFVSINDVDLHKMKIFTSKTKTGLTSFFNLFILFIRLAKSESSVGVKKGLKHLVCH